MKSMEYQSTVTLLAGMASQATSPESDTRHAADDDPVKVNVETAARVALPLALYVVSGNLGVVVSTDIGPLSTLQSMPILVTELLYDPAWNRAVVVIVYTCPG
jgi:hypothetical protein